MRPEDQVRLPVKIAFGLGGLVTLLTGQLPRMLVVPVYVVALGMSPALASTGMLILRVWDALSDPFVGSLSDNTRSRWGRRRPYLLIGAVLSAACLPLMWLVQGDWSTEAQFAWLVFSGVVILTCAKIYCVPYESYLLELTPDYDERSRIMTVRSVIGAIGGLFIGWAWYLTQLPWLQLGSGVSDTVSGARGVSLVAAACVLAIGFLPIWATGERYYAAAVRQPRIALRKQLSNALGNRAFLVLAATAAAFVTGAFLTGDLGFYLRLYYVCRGDTLLASALVGHQSVVWLIASLLAAPVFQHLSVRFGKQRALQAALASLFLGAASRWWMVTPDQPSLYVANAAFLAVGIAGAFQILPAMNADVVDSGELATGARCEGTFASVLSWFIKMSFTASVGLAGYIVTLCGFSVENQAEQPVEVIQALRLFDCLLPSTLLLAAILLSRMYPLSPDRMREIRQRLEDRRGNV